MCTDLSVAASLHRGDDGHGGAVAAARESAPDDAETESLNDGMRKDGWVLYLSYGTEGDCVRVIRRTMDGD